MSDEGQGGGGHGGAIRTGFGLFLFIALIVYALQIYLNKPEDRPAAACWPLYKSFWLAGVAIPKLVLPRDPEIALGAARRVASFNKSCICFVTKGKFLNEGENGNRLVCN